MAPHSSTLAWQIPWMEEHGGLQYMGLQRVGHDWATSLSLFTFMHWRRKWQPTPVFLPGESPGMAEPGGLLSMGSHRVRHNWSNLAAAADFGIDHLVMSMCRVFSYVVGRRCLLWPVCSLGRTLLASALLHSVLQGQTCLLLQVSLDFLLLHPVPYDEKDIFFGCKF